MPISIPSPLVEFILLGPMHDRRQVQDSPILGDVWIEFGKRPAEALELLIAPYRGQPAGAVAVAIHDELQRDFELDLEFLPYSRPSGSLPARRRRQVIVVAANDNFHFRVFDARGNAVVDQDEMALRRDAEALSAAERRRRAQQITALKAELERYARLEDPSASDKARAVDTVLTFFGRGNRTEVAYLHGLVVATLTFEQLVRVVLPMTKWWLDKRSEAEDLSRQRARPKNVTVATAAKSIGHLLASANRWQQARTHLSRPEELAREGSVQSALDRFMTLTGLILWAAEQTEPERPKGARASMDDQIDFILKRATATDLAERFRYTMDALEPARDIYVYQVSLNRSAMPALSRSIPSVKADAAKTLFRVDCSRIAWAVIDSGIDSTHPAFQLDRGSRIVQSYDFANFRKVVSLSNAREAIRARNLDALRSQQPALANLSRSKLDRNLARLAADLRHGRSIRWDLVEPFVKIPPGTPPPAKHGTHVAGILGASKDAAKKAAPGRAADDFADGMCPDIRIYDFRVLGAEVKEVEFAIIASLQFIHHLNMQGGRPAIHGVNLSLSIPHDVRNYACGRTPICDECERLIGSGVVVVAAAGNFGRQSFQTLDGPYEGYAAFSITDPGNADGVITVGSTHRFKPHTYGVSFFSSRGPTGDGRLKPDLVAPGERIWAPVPNGEWGELDGTSMAAPHVSGAAALLMGRYSELIGQPREIKRILCNSATDLGRERSFQGHGMLDVLRAFQSI